VEDTLNELMANGLIDVVRSPEESPALPDEGGAKPDTEASASLPIHDDDEDSEWEDASPEDKVLDGEVEGLGTSSSASGLPGTSSSSSGLPGASSSASDRPPWRGGELRPESKRRPQPKSKPKADSKSSKKFFSHRKHPY
jgi:hypothetical protein